MDRRVTPPKRVTSPTWRTPPPCKQALSFKFFLQLLCISLVPMIFPYFAQMLLENALLCQQNARLKNRLFCSKFCRQNLSKPNEE